MKKKPCPIAKARNKLSREIVRPVRRLHALGLLLRDRDLDAEELKLMAQAAEQVRANVGALRRGAR